MYNVCTVNIGLSDHLPVFAVRRFKKSPEHSDRKQKHFSLEYHNLKNLDHQSFVKDLNCAPWDAAFVFEEIDDVVESWNKHAPLISERVKRTSQPKWFTSDLNKEIQNRDSFLKKARSSNDPNDWSAFRQAKNKVTQLIRNKKKSFFESKVNENRNNPKKLWSLIKDLSRTTQKEGHGSHQLEENGKLVCESKQIADLFNSFFVSQPYRLLAAIKSSFCESTLLASFSQWKKCSTNFMLPHITSDKVLELLQAMPISKATGIDGLSPRILKIAAPAISVSISQLINRCIATFSFPSLWKIAKVTPIFKDQGSRTDKQNYRPISVLPVLSKLYERHVYDALNSHLIENDLLYGLQSGFRKRHSTETALIRLLDQILFDLDLPSVIPNSTVDVYADDTTFSSSSHFSVAPIEIQTSLQEDIDKLCQWTDQNQMVLNASKTKSILVTGQRLHSRLECSDLILNASGTDIEQVSSQKLLGVIFDSKLTFKQHVDKLCKRLSQKIGLLRKIRSFLPVRERKLFYDSLIKPTLMYGSSVWSCCCSKSDLQRILRLQKRSARVILERDTSSRSMANFFELNWLPFFDEIKINNCTLIYKRLHGEVPRYIEELFKSNQSVHGRNTRHGSYNLVCPKFKNTTEGGKSFTVTNIKLWNSLSNNLKSKPNVKSFKSGLKKHFLESYRDIDCFELLM